MEKIKRDTTRDLFNAVLQLVNDNSCYDKAKAIMEYYLPNVSESNVREDIELTAYEFDFCAAAQFGGSEGIYIDIWLSGKYSENELMRYNHGTGKVEKETRRSIGTFKTLRTDLEAMQIMGELCGSLVYWGHKYVNQNIDRYSPVKELEYQQRYSNASAARSEYISELSANMSSDCKCEPCDGKICKGKKDGCNKGVAAYIQREVGKYCSMTRYQNDERNQYFTALDGSYRVDKDTFADYVAVITRDFPDLSIYQAVGYVFVWLCTRKDF